MTQKAILVRRRSSLMPNQVMPPLAEQLQSMVARLVANSRAGHGLCLIGGFRYRLLDHSPRRSGDIDYHWAGDLDTKSRELVALFERRLCGADIEVFINLPGISSHNLAAEFPRKLNCHPCFSAGCWASNDWKKNFFSHLSSSKRFLY